MKTVTKAQAAVMLGISPNEVVRRIESGALKGRKKTTSKFSDWLVELPDEGQGVKTVATIKEVLVEPEVPKEGTIPEEIEVKEETEPEIKKEVVILKEEPKKEVKLDDRTKSEDREVKWWFGNRG